MTKHQMMYDQLSIPDCTHLQLRHHAITVPPAVLHRNTAEGIWGGMRAKLPFMPRGGLWCGLFEKKPMVMLIVEFNIYVV